MNFFYFLCLCIFYSIIPMENNKVVKDYKFTSPIQELQLSSAYYLPNGDIIQPQYNPFHGTIEWISKSSKIEKSIFRKTGKAFKNIEFLKMANAFNDWITIAIYQDQKPNDSLCVILDRPYLLDPLRATIEAPSSSFENVALFSVIGDLFYKGANKNETKVKKDCKLLLVKTIEKYSTQPCIREEEYLYKADEELNYLGEIKKGILYAFE